MHSDAPPDDQLLGRVATGDAEAFTVLFRRRQGDVYRFALHMTASPAIADDVTQETFLAVMRDAQRFEPGRATVVAWLCGIARNHVRRRLERDRAHQSLDFGSDDLELSARLATDDDPLGDLTRAERLAALRGAVLTLPLRYREAVVLCDLQELSYADAASAIGCAVGTVRSRLHRGRALLARKLTTSPEKPRESASGSNEKPRESASGSNEKPRESASGSNEKPRESASGVNQALRIVRSARNLA